MSLPPCYRLCSILLLLLALAGILPTASAQDRGTSEASQPAPAKVSDMLDQEDKQQTIMLDQVFGPGMWPIWICSILLVAFTLERRNALKPAKILDEAMVERVTQFVGELRLKEAEEDARRSPTVLGQAWAQALHEFSLGGIPLLEALTNSTLLAFKPLKKNLQAISTLAVLSPLLGLYGTVLGMVITFGQIAAVGGADKSKLASGIALALYTTVGGLTVAMPAIVIGRYFSSRLTALAEQAEAAIHRLNYRYHHAMAHPTSIAPESSNPRKQDVSHERTNGAA